MSHIYFGCSLQSIILSETNFYHPTDQMIAIVEVVSVNTEPHLRDDASDYYNIAPDQCLCHFIGELFNAAPIASSGTLHLILESFRCTNAK